MGKELSRKCSHCGNNGHNSRTCGEKGLKIFGVRILGEGEEVMRKSKSLGNLTSCVASDSGARDNGYLSDGLVHSRRGGERKRGVPWTEEEHRTFLAGLEKLGKGDWRGISRNFVTTKTPTQVASHAQKYFLRQSTQNKRKRRSSLFDLVIHDTPSTSETTPALGFKTSTESPREASILQSNIYMPCSSAGMTTQLSLKVFEASEALPFIKNHGDLPSFQGTSFMMDENRQAKVGPSLFPSLSLISAADFSARMNPYSPKSPHDISAHGLNFLQLAFNPRPQSDPHYFTSATSCSTSIEGSDLELTIAPPVPMSTGKLASGASNFSSAIRVI